MTALIAMQVKKVVSLQADPTLYANTLLRLQPYHNIELRCASGVEAVQGATPFDAIIVNGALAEAPEVLLQQLAPGGRLLAILGSPPVYSACRIVRELGGGFEHEKLFETSALPLKGFHTPSRFRF
jgi:protein-L-isoaspartate(D-aspartate) O-methyltransferase